MTKSVDDLTQLATELTVATQAATLHLFEARMQALAQMMPGTAGQLEQSLPTDEEVEQGFENMPV